MEFVTTSIRLPRKTLDDLKVRAARDRKSLAQMIRDAIARTFHIGVGEGGADPMKDPFYGLVGAWESGITDGAVHHDRDIYGADP